SRCREMGVGAYVTKPIAPSDLLEAIQSARRAPLSPEPAAPEPPPAAAAEAPAASGLRLLLAEDNPVNQRVAILTLRQMGHSVEVASNGREAVARFTASTFDLILMDVQMPEMSGLEATRAIRDLEQARGTGHIPIVALTAHAMKGDRERCVAAGMDE